MREDRRSFGEEITPAVTGPVSGANDEDEDEDWEDEEEEGQQESTKKKRKTKRMTKRKTSRSGLPLRLAEFCQGYLVQLCLVLLPRMTPTRFLRAAKSHALLESASDNCSGGTNAR